MRRHTTTAARMWDVYGGQMLNAQRYICKNDVYFTSTATIQVPYGIKRLFDRIANCNIFMKNIHIILHWIWIS